MSAPAERVAVIGTGVIGAGWAALFLAHGLDVVAFDPAGEAEPRLRAAVGEAWPMLTRLGLADGADPARLRFADHAADAVSAVVGEGRSIPDESSDVEYSTLWVKRRLTEVYEEVRRRPGSPRLESFVRDVTLGAVGDMWCRFLSVASFVRLHAGEVYPPDSNWYTEYWRDLSSRFSELMQDFRRTTLRSILST